MIHKRKIRVREVMVSDLHTIDGLATVTEAVEQMNRHSVSSLVVNRRNEDDETGIIDVAGIHPQNVVEIAGSTEVTSLRFPHRKILECLARHFDDANGEFAERTSVQVETATPRHSQSARPYHTPTRNPF